DFARVARRNPERPITVEVARGSGHRSLTVTPDRREETDPVTKRSQVIGFVGIGAAYPTLPRPGVLGAIRVGWAETRTRAIMILATSNDIRRLLGHVFRR